MADLSLLNLRANDESPPFNTGGRRGGDFLLNKPSTSINKGYL